MSRISRRSKRRVMLLVAMTLIAAFAAVTFRVVRTVQQQRLIADARAQGMSAFAAGDLKTTLNQLSYYFEHEKDDLEVNLTFAEARARLPLPQGQHLAEAVDLYFTHGLKLLEKKNAGTDQRERRVQILSKLLDLYGQLGLRVEVSRTADQLLAISPDSVQALGAKGEVLILDHHFDEADKYVTRLIELDPDDLSWRRLALDIQIGQGVPLEKLVEQCREWASQYQGDGRFHLLTASILSEMDLADAARQELQRAAQLGATTFHVLERCVSLLDLLEMRDEASTLLDATMRRYPDQAWVREVAVRRLWHENRLVEARDELAKAKQQLPSLSAPLRRLEALTQISASQFAEAQTTLQAMIKDTSVQVSDGDRAWATALVAALDASNSKWRDRIDTLGYALALSPEDPVLHFIMGEACAAVGENSQAIIAFKNAYELDPDWMLAGVAYAEAMLASGRVADAYNISRAVVTRSPRDQYAPLLVFARSYLGLRKAGEHRLAGAEGDLLGDLIIALDGIHDPEHLDRRVAEVLAQAHTAAEHRDHAVEVVRQSAATLSNSADVLRLVEFSREIGLGLEQELLEQARRMNADADALALAESQWRAASGDIEGALAAVNTALRTSTSIELLPHRQLRCARVQLLFEQGDEAAVGEARRLIADFPADVDVQRFALSQTGTWDDVQLVARGMANLKEILGERSPQVRLAEANFLLRHHSQNDAMLAKAISLINGVLQQTPDSLAALSLRAQAMMIGPRPNVFAAIESLERATALYPAESNLLVRLISILQRQGEFESAGLYLSSLAELSRADSQLRSVELRLLESQGDFELALVRAASIVSQDSPPPDQLVLASIHEQAGHREDARVIYEQLLAEHPADELIVSQAASFFANIGEFDRGLDLLKSIERNRDPAAQALAIGMFYQRYERDEAGEWLIKAVHDNPQSIEARLALAKHHLQKQNRGAAREQALAGLAISPNDTRLQAIMAISSLNASPGERAQALKTLKQISAGDDDLLATLAVLELAGPDQNAPSQRYIAESQKLVKEHGNFLPAWLLAITLHVQAGYQVEAISLARQAVSGFASETEPAKWSTELLMQAGRWREALVDAREWRRRSKASTLEADAVIANILIELGRPREAVKQLEANAELASAQSGQHPERLAAWLRALAHAGEVTRAIEIVQPLLNQLEWRETWCEIAMQLEPDVARDALIEVDQRVVSPQEALEIASRWAELAKRSGSEDCFERAQINATKAAAQPDLLIQSLIAQGGIAEARGEWSQAESKYRQAIQSASDEPIALNNLASVIARAPDRCDEALDYIRHALELAPANPDFLDTYATVLLGMNRFDEAEAALAQALASRPADIAIKLNFIEVLLRQEKIDQARDELFALQQRIQGVLHADPVQQKRLHDLLQRVQTQEQVIGT